MLKFTLRITFLFLVGVPFWLSCTNGGNAITNTSPSLRDTCRANNELTCLSTIVNQWSGYDAAGNCCDFYGNFPVNSGSIGYQCEYGASSPNFASICFRTSTDAFTNCENLYGNPIGVVQCNW